MTRTTKRRLTALIVVVLFVGAGLFGLVKLKESRREAERERTASRAMEAYEAGEYERALPLFSSVVRREGSEYEQMIAFATARAAVPSDDGGHLSHALTLAKLAEGMRPEALAPKELLLDLYGRVGYAPELIETAESILSINSEHYRALSALPTAHLSLSDEEAALSSAERFARAYPDDLDAQRMHVGFLLRRDSPESVILEKLEELEGELGDTPEVLIVRSGALMELGESARAVDLVRETLERSPADAGILEQMLGIALAASGSDPGLVDEVDAHIGSVVESASPGDGVVALGFERWWQRERPGRVVRRVESFGDNRSEMDTVALGYALLSSIELERGALSDDLRAALRARGDGVSGGWLAVGEAYGSLDRESIESEIGPASAREAMRYVRGLFYRSIGESELAEREWAGLAMDPQWRRARHALADMLIGEDRYREAREVVLAEGRPEATIRDLLLLGEATARLLESGESVEGDELFAETLLDTFEEAEGEGVSGVTLDALAGRLALAVGRSSAAARYAESVIEKGPSRDARATSAFARALSDERPALAGRLLDALGEGEGVNVQAVFARAEALFERGEADRAVSVLEEAIASSSGSRRFDLERALARVLARTDPEAAVDRLVALAQSHPENPSVQRELLSFSPAWSRQEAIARAIGRLREATGEEGIAWRVYDARYTLGGEVDQKGASRVVLNLTEALRVDPDHVEALMLLSEAYRYLENRERSVAFRERALEASDDKSRVYPLLVRDLLRLGLTERARDRLRDFAALEGVSPEIRRVRADLLESQSMLDTALADRTALASSGEPADLIALASLRVRRGEPGAARSALASIDGDSPLGASEAVRLAELYDTLGETERAESALARVPASSQLGHAALVRAGFHLRTGDADRAREILREFGASSEGAGRWLEIARLYRSSGYLDDARGALERARALEPSHPDIGAMEESITALVRATESGGGVGPGDGLGGVVFDVDREGLGAVIGVLAEDDPSEAGRALGELGRRYASGEIDVGAFIDRLSQLATENPLHYPSWRVLLHARAESGRIDEAVASVRTMVRSFPTDPRPARLAMALLWSRDQTAEALSMARLWRDRRLSDPRQPSVAIAALLLELDRGREALETLGPWSVAIESAPLDDAGASVLYAEALAKSGSVERAYAVLRPIVESGELDWASALGILEFGASDREAYLALLREIDSSSSGTDGLSIALARAWYREGLRSSSRDALSRAVELASRSESGSAPDGGPSLEASVVLAGASYRLGRVDEAIEHYRRAATMSPDDPDLLNNLAYLLLESGGDGSESIDLSMRAVSLNQESGGAPGALKEYYDTLALAYMRAGRYDRAASTYQAALDIEPGNAALRLGLVEALIEQGETDEASSAFEPLRSLPDGHALHERVREVSARLEG